MLANSHRAEQPGESISAPDERFQKCAVELDLLAAVQQNERTGPVRIPDGKPAAGRRLPKQGGCQVQLQHDVLAKYWSETIEECTARLKFFHDRLNYNASQSSGRKYLRDTYPKVDPSETRGREAAIAVPRPVDQ